MSTLASRPGEVDSTNRRPHGARVTSIDVLRGLVMVLMALDHVRDYLGAGTFSPTHLDKVTFFVFFTRWITHLCAPTFVFLAGTAAYLQLQSKSKRQLSRFLLTRGVWLCFIEVTAVHIAWTFHWPWDVQMLQVIWVIGLSMMLLAGLIYLPLPAILGISILLIAGHNAFDHVRVASFGRFGWVWHLLHAPGFLTDNPAKLPVLVFYPLMPWPGIMALGYTFGAVLRRSSPENRGRWMAGIGGSCIALFVVLRALNLYGDPNPWSGQTTALGTFQSFMDVWKYPPSLLYTLLTLGCALLIMAGIEWLTSVGRVQRLRDFLTVYGRVPFFYYLLHICVAHVLALAVSVATGKDWRWWISELPSGGVFRGVPLGYGFNLATVWVLWVVVILLCYPACKWYANLKQRSRNPLLSYL